MDGASMPPGPLGMELSWKRKAMSKISMETPLIMPLGIELHPEGAKEIWDAYIAPGQNDPDHVQSIEERMLMGLLRAFHQGEIVGDKE